MALDTFRFQLQAGRHSKQSAVKYRNTPDAYFASTYLHCVRGSSQRPASELLAKCIFRPVWNFGTLRMFARVDMDTLLRACGSNFIPNLESLERAHSNWDQSVSYFNSCSSMNSDVSSERKLVVNGQQRHQFLLSSRETENING